MKTVSVPTIKIKWLRTRTAKKVNVPKKKPMRSVVKKITVGPFYVFKLKAIHKKDISVTEWRNRHADLKADDVSEDENQHSESGSDDQEDE